MERTMFFSDWVNEYKPVQFNEDVSRIALRAHRLHRDTTFRVHRDASEDDGLNTIGKYLIKNPKNSEFPDDHIWKVLQMVLSSSSLRPPQRPGGTRPAWGQQPAGRGLDHMIVTRKPRIEHEDKIIIDFSKEPGRYFSNIILVRPPQRPSGGIWQAWGNIF